MKEIQTKPKMEQVKVRGKYSVIRDARSILQQHQIEQREEKRIQTKNPTRYATDHIEQGMKRSAKESICTAQYVSAKLKQKRMTKELNQTRSMGEHLAETNVTEPENKMGSSVFFHPVEPHEIAQQKRESYTSLYPTSQKRGQSTSAAPSKHSQEKVIARSHSGRNRVAQTNKNGANLIDNGKEAFQGEHARNITIRKKKEGRLQGAADEWNRYAVRYQSKPESILQDIDGVPKSIHQPIHKKQKMEKPAVDKQKKYIIPSMQRFQKQQWQKRLLKQNNKKKQRTGVRHSADLVKSISTSAVHIVKTAVQPIFAGAVGSILLVVVLFFALFMSLSASPFGIFFSGESVEPGTVPVSVAVNQVQQAFSQELAQVQESENYDDIVLHGSTSDWAEVLAVFAAKLSGKEDAETVDVVVIDEAKIAKLQQIFFDMNPVTSKVEEIYHVGEEETDGWTERILHITIQAKSVEEMASFYQFTKRQTTAMQELLAQRALLWELAGTISMIGADAETVLKNLPEDLTMERQQVVEQAVSLVGKVNYFWGGKSLTIGWNSSWGELRKVTAAGSPTTGTYRPYGLDCSGFIDWVFYNATDRAYVMGQGGGVASQRTQCTMIRWENALPGDLVFYSDNSHIGIVAGRDTSGDLQVIHCASGANTVVITGVGSFDEVGRPKIFDER